MSSVTIFFGENDNLYKEIARNKLLKDEEKAFLIAEYIEMISKKTYTNYVGYFKYLNDKSISEIYIVPKNIRYFILDKYKIKSLNEMNEEQKQECEEMMVSYIRESMMLLSKHDGNYKELHSSDYIEKNLLNKDKNNIDIEEIIELYYKYILLEIKKRLNKYIDYLYLDYTYNSKNINSSKIDVYTSIIELDKSKIHIKSNKKILTLELINIVYNAIEIFKKTKLQPLNNNEITDITNYIQKMIKKKAGYRYKRVKEEQIISNITKYKFNNNKKLYKYILLLIGYERLNLDYSESIESLLKYEKKINGVINILINSDKTYEYKVYEYCKSRWNNYRVKMNNSKEIIMYRYSYNKEFKYKKSKPDILIYDIKGNVKAVIDAKWKIVENIESDIKEEDINKLIRDARAWANISVEKHLIYPVVPTICDGMNIEFIPNISSIKSTDEIKTLGEDKLYKIEINQCR